MFFFKKSGKALFSKLLLILSQTQRNFLYVVHLYFRINSVASNPELDVTRELHIGFHDNLLAQQP